MIKDSVKELFEIVLVWKLDRFSRDRYDSAHYKHILKKNGVKVISAKEHISEGPEGIILEAMLEGYAEFYSAELSEKIHRGQKENALKGKNNGGGVPLGYLLDKKAQKLVIDPVTAPLVVEIFEKYADGKSVRSIVEDFNTRRLKTKKGQPFNINSFSSLLKNRKYIGEYRYQDVVIEGGVPAIVPEDLFNRVQERMEKNRHTPAMAKAKEDYLLTTKLFCGKCERMMVGESGKSHTGAMHYYYKCNGAKRLKDCDKKAVRKDWIERVVVHLTMQRVMDEEKINRLIDAILVMQEQEDTTTPALRSQLAETESSIGNILKAIEQGIFTPSTKQRLDELEARKEEILVNIQTAELQKPKLTREQMTAWFEQFRHGDPANRDFQKRLIDTFVNAVYVFDDKLVLTYNYQHGTQTISLDEIASALSSDFDGATPPHVSQTNPLCSTKGEEPHRFAVRLFPFHLIASLSHEIKQHIDVLTDGAEIVSSAAPTSIVPGTAAHLIQELFLPHQNGVSDPLVFLYKGFQLLIFFYDTDVGQVLREGTGIEPVRLRVKVQRRQRVQRLIGVPHIGMPVIFFRRLLEASYPILGLADRLIVVEQRLSVVAIELVGVRIAVCIVLVLERLDAFRPRGTVKPDAHRLRMGGQSCHDRQGQNPRCDRRNKFSSHDKTSFL